jgi:hypothetical protein
MTTTPVASPALHVHSAHAQVRVRCAWEADLSEPWCVLDQIRVGGNLQARLPACTGTVVGGGDLSFSKRKSKA